MGGTGGCALTGGFGGLGMDGGGNGGGDGRLELAVAYEKGVGRLLVGGAGDGPL